MNFFDLHSDTPYECYKQNRKFYVNQLAVSGEQGKVFDNWAQTFAFWIKDDLENPFEFYRRMYKDFCSKLKEKPENLTPVLAVEGGAVLEEDICRLSALKSDGIKLLTLTWNGENRIAGGNKTDKCLTDFGKEVIMEMNCLKMGCDLSHINEKSFYSAVQLAEYPLATHSCCKSIFHHPRNLTDEQIRLITEKNGIIGLCFYPDFLGGEVYEKIYENIYHLLELGFEDSIAIGSDFDGAPMDEKLKKISDVPHFREFLSQKGIETEIIDKIFYNNAHNFIAKLT